MNGRDHTVSRKTARVFTYSPAAERAGFRFNRMGSIMHTELYCKYHACAALVLLVAAAAAAWLLRLHYVASLVLARVQELA